MAGEPIETQPASHEQMVAQPGKPGQTLDVEQQSTESKRPRLRMRGGGIILDLCACFICCEICKDCCEAIDDCCCC